MSRRHRELPDQVALVVILYDINFDRKPTPMFDAHITVVKELPSDQAPMTDEDMRGVSETLARQLGEAFDCKITSMGVRAGVLDDDEVEVQKFVQESMDDLHGKRVMTKWEGLVNAMKEGGPLADYAGAEWEQVSDGQPHTKGTMKA